MLVVYHKSTPVAVLSTKWRHSSTKHACVWRGPGATRHPFQTAHVFCGCWIFVGWTRRPWGELERIWELESNTPGLQCWLLHFTCMCMTLKGPVSLSVGEVIHRKWWGPLGKRNLKCFCRRSQLFWQLLEKVRRILNMLLVDDVQWLVDNCTLLFPNEHLCCFCDRTSFNLLLVFKRCGMPFSSILTVQAIHTKLIYLQVQRWSCDPSLANLIWHTSGHSDWFRNRHMTRESQ